MAVLYGRIGGAWVPISSSMDNEVVIGSDDPITSYPTAELWYDTDAVTLPVTGFVPTAGGTMTGDLSMATPANINFGSATRQMLNLYDVEANSFGIGIQPTVFYFRTNGTSNFAWYKGGVHADTAYDPGAGGTKMMDLSNIGRLTVGFVGGTAVPLDLIGSSLNNSYLRFFAEGDTTTRSGYVGFPGNAHLYISSDKAAGDIRLQTLAGGGNILFITNGTEAARITTGNVMLVGKAASDLTNAGVELLNNGRIYSTTDTSVAVNSVFNITTAAVGNVFASFRRSNTQIGSVACATTSTVVYNTSSDRRLKRIIGPVADAGERVRQLKVWHFAWKADDIEQDGLIADEVQPIVPIAVTGEPDAVDEDGNIEAQQMDYSKLVPLLTAALQEALDRIDALEQRIDTLEAA